ncbi:MAG TPA: SxtJ family membrane protein [Candidatus Saccharimonadales bacterium]|nr:SxtJ family membrane protein [Candidatus Saccharimonadales bacterium]
MAVPARLTAREGRKFAFTVGIAFLVLAALSAWRGHHLPPRVLGAVGVLLLLAGLVVPGRLGPVQRWWMKLAHAISKVTSPIVVGASYYVVLTPIGWVMRAFGRNPLRHRERDGGFWIPAPSGGRSDLDTQF